jgi:hypothetical protein
MINWVAEERRRDAATLNVYAILLAMISYHLAIQPIVVEPFTGEWPVAQNNMDRYPSGKGADLESR